jgi:hypothetical protein
LHMGGTLGQVGTMYWIGAPGGAAIRQDMVIAPGRATRETIKEDHPVLLGELLQRRWGRSERINLQPELDFKIHPGSPLRCLRSGRATRTTASTRHLHRLRRGTALHFAHLDQSTLSFTWRLGYTFTPNTSLQVYASPFISRTTRTCGNWISRGRMTTTPDTSPTPLWIRAASLKQFGPTWCSGGVSACSTLFVVWSQAGKAVLTSPGHDLQGRHAESLRPAGERRSW